MIDKKVFYCWFGGKENMAKRIDYDHLVSQHNTIALSGLIVTWIDLE